MLDHRVYSNTPSTYSTVWYVASRLSTLPRTKVRLHRTLEKSPDQE